MRRSAARLLSAQPQWASITAGLPLVVGAVEGSGRGLFAVTDIPLTHTPLFTATPVACHPPLHEELSASTCAACLRSVPRGQRFCCPACAASPWAKLEGSSGWRAFEALAREQRSVFALLAGRHAASCSAGISSHALDALCFANLHGATPAAWEEQYAALEAALRRRGSELDWLSLSWFTGVLSRLHLNAFRVDLPRTDVSSISTLALHAAHGSGTAVYGPLASLLNHDCDPCLDAVWRSGDATLSLVARRPISAGEQLTITYVDSGAPMEERRAELEHAYGFTCRCAMCREEEAEGPM